MFREIEVSELHGILSVDLSTGRVVEILTAFLTAHSSLYFHLTAL